MKKDMKFWKDAMLFSSDPSKKNEMEFIISLKNLDLYILTDQAGNLVAEVSGGESHIIACTDLYYLENFIEEGYCYEKRSYDYVKHFVLDRDNNLDGISFIGAESRMNLDFESILNIDRLLTGMTLVKTRGLVGDLDLKPAKKLPGNLLKDLREFSLAMENINQINLYRARRNPDKEYHWLFLVDFDGGDMEVFPSLAPIIQKSMDKGDIFELVKADLDGELMENMSSLIYRANY